MDILRDQKYVWLFPLQLARGRHLTPTVVIVGLTAGLVAADRYDMPYFFHTTQFNGFNEVFTKTSTEAMMAVVPVSLLVFGLADHDNYAEQTAILAGEAYIDSAIPHVAIKFVARRLRPDSPQLNGNYSDTFFRSNLSVFSNGSSFPSGHAAGAFAIAAVIARRYESHRWVPWAAYGFAALLSFSRIPARGHYPSDVFLGAAMGYAIARYDIFRER
jgi:membrane-associated phospholipid phosphatase